jgi:hypothetical protein
MIRKHHLTNFDRVRGTNQDLRFARNLSIKAKKFGLIFAENHLISIRNAIARPGRCRPHRFGGQVFDKNKVALIV